MPYYYEVMDKKLSSLLLICLFVSILGVAFHYHSDGVFHEGCSICSFALHHANCVFQNSPQISAPSYNIVLISLENSINILHAFWCPYSNRAPPAL
jgi:hypothetical protein